MEHISYASATLHSYNNPLWSNYGYGKKKDTLQSGKYPLSGNDLKIKRREFTMSAKNSGQLNVPLIS
jgi:hypothetical protein